MSEPPAPPPFLTEEEQYRLTLEGLADVDAGRIVDHTAAHAWIASLRTDHPLPLPKPA